MPCTFQAYALGRLQSVVFINFYVHVFFGQYYLSCFLLSSLNYLFFKLHIRKSLIYFVMVIFVGTYIKEDCVSVSISVMSVYSIKPLRELNITDFFPVLRIHQEAHGFPDSLAIVYVVITVQVQHERSIGKNTSHAHLQNLSVVILYNLSEIHNFTFPISWDMPINLK